MKHAPEYIETMKKLVPLLREHRRFSVWKFDILCDWVAYFWNRGTISYVIDDWGNARGVCLVKLFRVLPQFLEPFVHEPCGGFCMIELMVADGPETLGWLHDDLVRRWGEHEIVMWDRGERTEGGSPRIYRWNEFERLARRITKMKQEQTYG